MRHTENKDLLDENLLDEDLPSEAIIHASLKEDEDILLEHELIVPIKTIKWKWIFLSWCLISFIVIIGIYLEFDGFIVGEIAVITTIVTQSLTGLLAVLSSIPVIGVFLVGILKIPIIWFINGVGYLASFIAIKRGYSKDVITYRSLTIAVLIGITIGYILGKLI